MSDMRDLINKLERIDERQNWDSLNTVIDQYAKPGMTLQDLASMEQAARDVDENTGGIGGFFKVGETDKMLQALEASFGIQVQREGKNQVYLTAAK